MSEVIDFKEILANQRNSFTQALFAAETVAEVKDAVEDHISALEDTQADLESEDEEEDKAEIISEYEKLQRELGN